MKRTKCTGNNFGMASVRLRATVLLLAVFFSLLWAHRCLAPIEVPDETSETPKPVKTAKHKHKSEAADSLLPEEREMVGKYTFVPRLDGNGFGEISIYVRGGRLACSGKFTSNGVIPMSFNIVASGSSYSTRGIVSGFVFFPKASYPPSILDGPAGHVLKKYGTTFGGRLVGDFAWDYLPSESEAEKTKTPGGSAITEVAEFTYDPINQRLTIYPSYSKSFFMFDLAYPFFQKR